MASFPCPIPKPTSEQSVRCRFNLSWDGEPLELEGGIPVVTLEDAPEQKQLRLSFDAPYYDSVIPPVEKPGTAVWELWTQEVLEFVIVGRNECKLHIMLCPHGHHLVMLHQGEDSPFVTKLPLSFRRGMDSASWGGAWSRCQGSAEVPYAYLPPPFEGSEGAEGEAFRYNAYHRFGPAAGRKVRALFPQGQGCGASVPV